MIRERILTMGITGSGKSYQWLKIAEELLYEGSDAVFRCLDTDNDIEYMLETQFQHLLPENKGNVHTMPIYSWEDYKSGIKWVLSSDVKNEDWLIIDRIDTAWEVVQGYFADEVFGENIGDYFLNVRKTMRVKGDVDAKGKPIMSIVPEGLSGWVDWVVIKKLYADWIRPIVYRVPCHVYCATGVERLPSNEKNPELLSMFGGLDIKPTGNKSLGGQMHSIFLLSPGVNKWMITTIKDRSNREYFNKVRLISFYNQYLVAKAGWGIGESDE